VGATANAPPALAHWRVWPRRSGVARRSTRSLGSPPTSATRVEAADTGAWVARSRRTTRPRPARRNAPDRRDEWGASSCGCSAAETRQAVAGRPPAERDPRGRARVGRGRCLSWRPRP
jgi:hypothetical protein